MNQLGAFQQGFLEEQPGAARKVSEGEEGEEVAAAVGASVLKVKLDELKISSRTLNSLREAGIKTVAGLSRKREETLREIPGIGEKGIQEIKKAIGNLGITLKQ
jgi:DNA-directed RNA polymerase subunit alpha